MDTDDDYQLALLLQAEYALETSVNVEEDDIYFVGDDGAPSPAIPSIAHLPLPGAPGSPKSVVDKEWELLDPNPDIRALFLQFNEMFFWSTLNGIEVKWSPRMTLCAGLCVYEGRGGLCSVRLSLPLLKLRPRKDLVETLLHEMIHAYLFITDNNKDHDGHGPEFQKHMTRINSSCGSSISIYHTFHDEVDSYRQHWWRCSGPCQKRPPYFGFVKRTMNRAPSARDTWWSRHQASCDGSYTKVREPEDYGKKKTKSKVKEIEEKKKDLGKLNDIRAFMGPGKLLGASKKDGEKEKSKPSSTVTRDSSDDDDVTVMKEKKNSVSGSSKGHSSGSSKHKSDDHKSHKDKSGHDKHRHGSHSSSKDHDHKHREHKSSSKGDSDRHKSSDKKHSSSSAKDSDSKKHSSSSKSSSSAAAISSKKKESTSSSGDKPKQANVHGFDSSSKSSKESDPGEPSPVAHGSNVHGFVKDSETSSKGKSSSSAVAFAGKGNVLGAGSSSNSKHKGDKDKHKHDKEKHRDKESKEKQKSHSKKRPSEEGSGDLNSKKARIDEEKVFGHGRTSKFRGDKPSTGTLNDPDDMVPCPVCATRVRATDINGHLDTCLGGL